MKISLLIGSLLLFSLYGGTALLAAPPEQAGRERDRQGENAGYIDLDSAVSRVRESTGGRILSAKTKRSDGRPVHVIRVMTESGKVRRIRIDAESRRRVE